MARMCAIPKQQKQDKTNRSSILPLPSLLLNGVAIILLIASAISAERVGAAPKLDQYDLELGRADPCLEYNSCASCAGAKYHGRRVLEEMEPSASKSSFERRMLRSPVTTNENKSDESSSSTIEWHLIKRRPHCKWCSLDQRCISLTSNLSQCHNEGEDGDSDSNSDNPNETYVQHEYSCPLAPPYPPAAPDFLPEWMFVLSRSSPSFSSLTLADLSLPGTHDSLSYDLSLTVSKGGFDDYASLSKWLRRLHPGEIEEFIRLQAKTQQLDIQQQLDNGIRFIDFRIMMESASLSVQNNPPFDDDDDDFIVVNDDDDAQYYNDDDNADTEWYSIHCLQSNQPAVAYLHTILEWLDEHPHEIIVIWFSKHGSTTATKNDAYPDVTPHQKRSFWNRYLDIMKGLLFDTRISNYHSTPISDLLRRNHRVVTFVSDYEEFTDSSPFALDASGIANFFNPVGVFDEVQTLQQQMDYMDQLRHCPQQQSDDSDSDTWFDLMSMNTPVPTWQVEDSARRRFTPRGPGDVSIDYDNDNAQDLPSTTTDNARIAEENQLEGWFDSCASQTNIPGMTSCPETLLDVSQLASYYNQISLENAYQDFVKGAYAYVQDNKHTQLSNVDEMDCGNRGRYFPHAFYLDALDYGGTVRTGTQLLFGTEHPGAQEEFKRTKYAYVDTVIAYNVHVACLEHQRKVAQRLTVVGEDADVDEACGALLDMLEDRREEHKMQLWDEPNFGRRTDWPPNSRGIP